MMRNILLKIYMSARQKENYPIIITGRAGSSNHYSQKRYMLVVKSAPVHFSCLLESLLLHKIKADTHRVLSNNQLFLRNKASHYSNYYVLLLPFHANSVQPTSSNTVLYTGAVQQLRPAEFRHFLGVVPTVDVGSRSRRTLSRQRAIHTNVCPRN